MTDPTIDDQTPPVPDPEAVSDEVSIMAAAPWEALGSRGPDGVWRLHLSAQEASERGGLAILLPEQVEALVQTIFQQQTQNLQAHGLGWTAPEEQIEKIRGHIAPLLRIAPGDLDEIIDAQSRLSEGGRTGGRARTGTCPASGRHADWLKLAERWPKATPWRAAINIVDHLGRVEPAGAAPAVRTVYPVLREDRSWQLGPPKNR